LWRDWSEKWGSEREERKERKEKQTGSGAMEQQNKRSMYVFAISPALVTRAKVFFKGVPALFRALPALHSSKNRNASPLDRKDKKKLE
jgi:hypothetical protein